MKKKSGDPKNKDKTPPKEDVLTKGEFFRLLNKVIQPVSQKAKPPKKEKKGT